MTIHELLNIRLDATGVTDMLKWLKENYDKGRKPACTRLTRSYPSETS